LYKSVKSKLNVEMKIINGVSTPPEITASLLLMIKLRYN